MLSLIAVKNNETGVNVVAGTMWLPVIKCIAAIMSSAIMMTLMV